MKKIGISLFLAVGVVGLFSLVVLAKSDKASAQSNVPQNDKVNKINGQANQTDEADGTVDLIGNVKKLKPRLKTLVKIKI